MSYHILAKIVLGHSLHHVDVALTRCFTSILFCLNDLNQLVCVEAVDWFCTSYRYCATKQVVSTQNECFCSPDYLWLLPRHCLLWFLSAYHEFVCHSSRKGHVWRLVLFQNTLKTYAWCISCQLQPYLNSSAMVAISYPTVIYLWLLSRSAFGARNKEKTTRWVYAQIIVEHWTLLSVCWILLLNETFCFHNLVK